jgi:hypothetical protein
VRRTNRRMIALYNAARSADEGREHARFRAVDVAQPARGSLRRAI